MRELMIVLVAAAAATLAYGSDALRVDGVPVYGRVRDVERIDIHQAIKAGNSHGSVFKVEVLGPEDIKVHLRKLGYIHLGRSAEIRSDGSRDHTWASGNPNMYDPEVLDLIRTAGEVYVFPVTTPRNPHRDDKQMRLLVGQARGEIIRLLGREQNWYVGSYNIIVVASEPAVLAPEPTNVGLVFRRGKTELVLFFSDLDMALAKGSFNGQYVADLLEDKPSKEFAKWCHRYAQVELARK
ncbi:MAG: hypothetical protein QOG48_725 [Verrucomicrobiota bacterium]|jgi:hypothetical protein